VGTTWAAGQLNELLIPWVDIWLDRVLGGLVDGVIKRLSAAVRPC